MLLVELDFRPVPLFRDAEEILRERRDLDSQSPGRDAEIEVGGQDLDSRLKIREIALEPQFDGRFLPNRFGGKRGSRRRGFAGAPLGLSGGRRGIRACVRSRPSARERGQRGGAGGRPDKVSPFYICLLEFD